jgi:DNA-directed RNA polymerase subunit RPC12/RpoP
MANMKVREIKALITQLNVLHNINIKYATPHLENYGDESHKDWYIHCPHCKKSPCLEVMIGSEVVTIKDARRRIAFCAYCGGELLVG